MQDDFNIESVSTSRQAGIISIDRKPMRLAARCSAAVPNG